jgi:hypothetical protein
MDENFRWETANGSEKASEGKGLALETIDLYQSRRSRAGLGSLGYALFAVLGCLENASFPGLGWNDGFADHLDNIVG